jgi:ankyrin repeat protein
MLHRHAESGNAAVLETMLACGFDPRVKDKDNITALHVAARSGYPDAVRVLLACGAPVNALDGWFSAPPIVWAVEGRSYPRPGTDHVGVARLLIAAGSPVEWIPPEHAPHPENTLEGLIDLRRAAEK